MVPLVCYTNYELYKIDQRVMHDQAWQRICTNYLSLRQACRESCIREMVQLYQRTISPWYDSIARRYITLDGPYYYCKVIV